MDTKSGSQNSKQTINDLVIGKWQLTKTEDESSRSRMENGLSKIVLNIQSNGYFIVYDTFVDPSWKKKGLPLIEERASGQWEKQGSKLILRYSDEDNNRVEELEITKLSSNELITKNKYSKAAVYKVYGKK